MKYCKNRYKNHKNCEFNEFVEFLHKLGSQRLNLFNNETYLAEKRPSFYWVTKMRKQRVKNERVNKTMIQLWKVCSKFWRIIFHCRLILTFPFPFRPFFSHHFFPPHSRWNQIQGEGDPELNEVFAETFSFLVNSNINYNSGWDPEMKIFYKL